MAIIATPGAADANSFETANEFQDYLDNRLHLPALVTNASDDDKEKALIMATRGICQILRKFKRLEIVENRKGIDKFYVVRPYWTGTIATTTQRLPWPRNGMLDANGNAIENTVIPQDLKDAESEMAILVITTDLTADNAIVQQGIETLKAGPVELQFKDYIQKRILPDVVYQTLVPSWMTDETYENIPLARFNTLGRRGHRSI